MANYIQGCARNQMFLFNTCLDDMIEEDNIIRFIDKYIETLDMEKLGFQMHDAQLSAPAYRPQLKLKIYVYGYLQRIRSSRRLEIECHRNKELIWLTEGLAPDFKTIADFRKDNHNALKNVFKNFLQFCHKLNLLAFKTVAIDGTKMRGENGLNEIYEREQIKKVEKEIQEKIDAYLKELDEADKKETEAGISINEEKVKEIMDRLNKEQKRLEKIDFIQELFEKDPELKKYFATDEDCRLQSDKGKVRAGYNPQIGVDAKEKLIIVADVTNEQNDKNQLSPMLCQVKEIKEELGIEEKTEAVADSGYFSEKQIVETAKVEDFHVVVSADAEAKGQKKDDEPDCIVEGYTLNNFTYDKEKDIFICPLGYELRKITQSPQADKNGRLTNKYQAEAEVCNNCKKKCNCTKGENGRILRVSVNYEFMLNYANSLKQEENKKIIAKRKEIVEHPFGTIKRSLGFTYFLLKGMQKVKAEFSLMCLIYNLKRVFNIMPIEELNKALTN